MQERHSFSQTLSLPVSSTMKAESRQRSLSARVTQGNKHSGQEADFVPEGVAVEEKASHPIGAHIDILPFQGPQCFPKQLSVASLDVHCWPHRFSSLIEAQLFITMMDSLKLQFHNWSWGHQIEPDEP